MKKLFFIFVFLLFFELLQAQENLFDFRLSTAGASPKYTLIHNGQGWQGFVQVGTGYMLWEAGPQIITKNLNFTVRAGVNFSYDNGDLSIYPQLALVLFTGWQDWHLLSINEYNEIEHYYYEQDLFYKYYSFHLEAVYQDGSYRPFLGPGVSFPIKKGNIFFWLAQRWCSSQKLARVGYVINF